MGDGGVGQVLGELAQAVAGVAVVGACRADADECGGAQQRDDDVTAEGADEDLDRKSVV